MLRSIVNKARQQNRVLNWERLAPRCSWNCCASAGARWHGMLRRFEGIHCDEHWYCSMDCLQKALEVRLAPLLGEPPATYRPIRHRMPLGLVLLSRGIIRHDQLQQALNLHHQGALRLGDCLRELGFATEDQVTSALATQWSCPVYPVERGTDCHGMIPHLLQRQHRMVPMHWVESTRDLYVAFEQSVNYTVLYAVERMLRCHTEPCLVPSSELHARLNQGEDESKSEREIAFEVPGTTLEMSRTICGYAQQVGAEGIRILGCDVHVWAQLEGKRPLDLLFRRWPA